MYFPPKNVVAFGICGIIRIGIPYKITKGMTVEYFPLYFNSGGRNHEKSIGHVIGRSNYAVLDCLR